MIIAPKGRGWSVIILDSPKSLQTYSLDTRVEETPGDADRRNRYWRGLRKRASQMPGVRIGK